MGSVGFVGLGNMGGAIATRLQDTGHHLVVHDLREASAAPYVARGATWASSCAEVARACDVVLVSVAGDGALEAVALGPGGVAEAAPRGACLVSLSTVAPRAIQSVAAELAHRGIRTLDAPVSGSIDGAREGTLLVAVGGDDADVAAIRPLIDDFAATVLHTGGIGSACVAKLAHNMLDSIARVAVAEAMTLAVKAGVDPEMMLEVLKAGAYGRARALHASIPSVVFTGDFQNTRGSLAESLVVTQLALDVAREHAVPVSFGSLTSQEIQAAVNRGWGEWNAGATFLLQEERAGVELRVKDPGRAERAR